MEKITDLVKVIFGGKIESFLIKFDSKIAAQHAAQQDHHRKCERGQGAAEQNIRESGPCGRHQKSLLFTVNCKKRGKKEGKKLRIKLQVFLWNILRICKKIDGIFRAYWLIFWRDSQRPIFKFFGVENYFWSDFYEISPL
jgi:hypothetical protein